LTWPPAFFSWFAAGMLLAEWIYRPTGWPHRLARRRLLMAAVVLLAYLVAASPLAGPAGLVPSSNAQFTVKTAMGALVAVGLVAPLVLDRPDGSHRFLASAPMVTLGRWSYGIFIWHLAALTMVFPVIGQFAFHGHLLEVLTLTLIFTIAMSAVSYALVESPCRDALRRWESRRNEAVSPRQEDAIAP
jgi:peptidoglycan/LPS O-acetylase OafA/YrhL